LLRVSARVRIRFDFGLGYWFRLGFGLGFGLGLGLGSGLGLGWGWVCLLGVRRSTPLSWCEGRTYSTDEWSRWRARIYRGYAKV
jgi:hypothetical protein